MSASLTEVEKEILKWLSFGKTASEIATIRGVSYNTTMTKIRLMREKMGAVNIASMVAMALRDGLIE